MNASRSSTRRETTVTATSMRPSSSMLRLHRRDAHVGRQRFLEAIEQVGPRERAPVDQQIGFARRRLHDGDVALVQRLLRRAGLLAQVAGPALRPSSARAVSSAFFCVERHHLRRR